MKYMVALTEAILVVEAESPQNAADELFVEGECGAPHEALVVPVGAAYRFRLGAIEVEPPAESGQT